VPFVLDRFSIHQGGLDLSGPFDLLASVIATGYKFEGVWILFAPDLHGG
jgi:hypothetical protein